MTVRSLVQWPDKRLLKPSQLVEEFDESLRALAEDLCHTMVANYGAGIAAPQVGVHRQVCVLDSQYVPDLLKETFDESWSGYVVLVNPEIQTIGEGTFIWEEACLSVPRVKGRVTRYEKIRLKYYNLSGEKIDAELSDIQAATVQHEVDHLFGKLYIHRMKGFERSRITKQLRKNYKSASASSSSKASSELGKLSDAKRKILRNKRKKKNKQKKAHRKNK